MSPYATTEEVAEHFAVSVSTVRQWYQKGVFPEGSVLKIGSTYRFRIPLIEDHFLGSTMSKGDEVTCEPGITDLPEAGVSPQADGGQMDLFDDGMHWED